METYPEYRQPPTQPPQPRRRPQRQKKTAIVVGVLIIVAIILIAVGFYFVLLPHAEVTVRINNDHSTSVEYQLNVDHRTFISGAYIPPFDYDEETFRFDLWSGGCDSYEFFVIAETGGVSYTDSTTVTLCNGDKTTVTLNP